MDYALLKSEIQKTKYNGLSAVAIAELLNEVPPDGSAGRKKDRDTVPSWEIFEATVPSEWGLLSASEKQRYQTMLAMGTLNIKMPNTRAALAAMFGPGTTTRANLLALQSIPTSQADLLFGAKVNYWDVERARNI